MASTDLYYVHAWQLTPNACSYGCGVKRTHIWARAPHESSPGHRWVPDRLDASLFTRQEADDLVTLLESSRRPNIALVRTVSEKAATSEAF